MKIYKVGGFVRDTLLGLTPKDVDYVVVGATPQEMTDLGYKQVGADFPVFLHPITGDEYALARTERKSGVGYNGFECQFGHGQLNPTLCELFVAAGFDLDQKYDLTVLMQVFQRMPL